MSMLGAQVRCASGVDIRSGCDGSCHWAFMPHHFQTTATRWWLRDRVRGVNTPPPSCLLVLPEICARVVTDFPVWEVVSTLLLTAAVTIVTIRWSVKAARNETQRSIEAARETEARERLERQEASAAESRNDENRQRIALAEAITRSVHELQAVQDLKRKDPRRLSVEFGWQSLRVTFRASALNDALQLYTFADLLIERGMIPRAEEEPVEMFVENMLRRNFASSIEEAAVAWIADGALPERASIRLRELEAERDAKQAADRNALFELIVTARRTSTVEEADPYDPKYDNPDRVRE